MILAYFLDANLDSSSDFAPVHTISPELKMRAVVLGSRILMITAAKRFVVYSSLRAGNAILFKSNLYPRLNSNPRSSWIYSNPDSLVNIL